MIPQTFTQTITLGDGRTITLETGKLAKQADGSVVVRMGNCTRYRCVCTASQSRRFSTLDGRLS